MAQSHVEESCFTTSLSGERSFLPGGQHFTRMVLSNAYLLHEIFEHLPYHKKGLLHVVLTCRDFLKPALRLLWSRLDTIIPLFKLLSNFRFRIGGTDGKSKIWYLNGPIDPKDMQKLVNFGSWVRLLGTYRMTIAECSLDNRVCLMIACALAGQSLLPNLRQLHLDFRPKWDDPAILHLIYSPHLRNINFHTPSTPNLNDISCFIQKLANSPKITSLVLNCSINLAVLQTTPSFKNLRNLTLRTKPSTAVPIDVIKRLSTLEHLVAINLVVHSFDSTANSNVILRFEKLQSFEVSCPIDSLLILLSLTTFPSLWNFQFNIVLPESPHSKTYRWTDVFDAVKSSTAESLSSLILSLCNFFPEAQARNALFQRSYPGVPLSELEASLLQLKLSSVDLNLRLFQSLTSEDVLRMAETWPELEIFTLWTASNSAPNLSTLKYLMERSSCLRDLSLDMDVREIPTPKKTRSSHRLTALNLRLINWEESSKSASSLSLATYIDSIFPHLIEVVCRTRDGKELKEISRIIDIIRQARRRERRYNAAYDDTDTDWDDDYLSD